jgi:hypothetical protein
MDDRRFETNPPGPFVPNGSKRSPDERSEIREQLWRRSRISLRSCGLLATSLPTVARYSGAACRLPLPGRVITQPIGTMAINATRIMHNAISTRVMVTSIAAPARRVTCGWGGSPLAKRCGAEPELLL